MNPVVSYDDFLEFMKYYNNPNIKDRLIPVVLIKPISVIHINERGVLNRIFDYFDSRTEKNIQFFLPGYAHFPTSAFAEVLPSYTPFNEDNIALRLNRLGTVYYNEKDFINFIKVLEEKDSSFKYYGDAELLFIKYESNCDYGDFDFSNIYRFSLSQLYFSNEGYRGLRRIEYFIEKVLLAIYESNDNEGLINTVTYLYNQFTER